MQEQEGFSNIGPANLAKNPPPAIPFYNLRTRLRCEKLKSSAMRVTYILAVAIAVTLYASTTAFPSAKDSKVAIENAVAVDPVKLVKKGEKLLRTKPRSLKKH
ncbi:hypothetical protein P3T76_000718 [Phytophthora citrophthora]|uniref:RxLR effector protein n=1 Tax=Phytophthora citrophthora TaxID=4793 RepID=A0AAD9LVR8_9STRA|nr:hypothetical protein P3T76_000718 [Phytophthora citrophthora]